MTEEEARQIFGFRPAEIGLRFRGWWVVDKIEEEEMMAGARIGYLAVKARDGGANSPDPEAFRKPNFVGTACDGFDMTYRYYFFQPLVHSD